MERQGGNGAGLLLGLLVAASLISLLLGGCSDMGSSPTGPTNSPQQSDSSQSQGISFKNQIRPIFQRYGCDGCHGGSGGLFVQTVAQLLQGGLDGPAVIPGKADSSIIIRKVSPNPPFGVRMPQGGPYLPDSTIQIMKLWINQGAKDN